jgi:hypothetical protein
MILSLARASAFCLVALMPFLAVAQSTTYYTIDPYDVPTAPQLAPGGTPATMWQMDPFARGYNLLSGYRPVYAGARQPMGHEVIPTRPDGNGYVYRPVYAPSPGYHYTYGGALVIEYPQQHPTLGEAAFPTLPPTNNYPAAMTPQAPNGPMELPPPRQTLSPTRPREF